MNDLDIRTILLQVANTDGLGFIIECSDTNAVRREFRNYLARLRKTQPLEAEEFSQITFRLSPKNPSRELLIINKRAFGGEQAPEAAPEENPNE